MFQVTTKLFLQAYELFSIPINSSWGFRLHHFVWRDFFSVSHAGEGIVIYNSGLYLHFPIYSDIAMTFHVLFAICAFLGKVSAQQFSPFLLYCLIIEM